MAFQISPGVNTSEIDLSTVVPAVSTTTGAIAGVFAWGPTDERILVSSEVELAKRFGKPKTGHNVETFFTAADFLAYSNSLYVVRVETGADNAVAAYTVTTDVLVDDDADPNTPDVVQTQTSTTELSGFGAKYKGELGDSLRVQVISPDTFNDSAYNNYFTATPDADHIHMVVEDRDGKISGTADTILEVHENVSLRDGVLAEDGTSLYITDHLERKSDWIAILDTDTSSFVPVDEISAQTYVFQGGLDGEGESGTNIVQEVINGYDNYKSAEDVDISLVLQGKAVGSNSGVELAQHIIDNIVEYRKDCLAFLSPARESTVALARSGMTAGILGWKTTLARSTSYAVMDPGYKYRYDKYNDKYVYTPMNGDIAGLCVRTDDVRDPWFSPAGYNRGFMKNVIKLPYNPNKTERDQLYKNNINPVITQPGQGTLLFGDKTLLSKPSAFDRINVRRLFIVLEKAVAAASKFTLFEFNDEFTRAQFKNLVEPYLRDVQGRRGIYDFRVVCDETNNTPEIIDRNEFIGDIYIKPARSINFIQLNFVAVRSGVEFEEIVGRF